jgi:hypothetical protein
MEMLEGSSLHCYLKQTKMHFFLLLQSPRTGKTEQVLSGVLVTVCWDCGEISYKYYVHMNANR